MYTTEHYLFVLIPLVLLIIINLHTVLQLLGENQSILSFRYFSYTNVMDTHLEKKALSRNNVTLIKKKTQTKLCAAYIVIIK